MRPKYEPYKPSKWEARIDAALRLVAPRTQFNRAIAREREHFFRYLSAYPSISRRNATANTSGETMRGAREKLAVMWNAIQCVENSGLCTGILTKFATYICGSLRWQARTGDRMINQEYEEYMKAKLNAIDITGRYSFRLMCITDIKSILTKGDIGCNIVRQGTELFLQGIEADRIGDPYDYQISDRYVRGLELSEEGMIQAVRVYRRDRAKGIYVFDQTFPMRDEMGMPKFLFMVNPISYDDYRGVSVFKTAIDNATYVEQMRQYELQALMWAASQSGVFHTQSGTLPEQLPFDSPNEIDATGNVLTTYQVRPNTVTALGVGEQVTMFQHDRPSPNVIGMFRDTIRDIAVGTGLSFEFIWDQSQLGGPAVRLVSGSDSRAIEMWQTLLLEQKLNPITMLLLGNAIANGELPYHPLWQRWQWFFPAKGTIDVGRESQANIQEIAANINTGARVAAEDGQDINEIQFQRGVETEQIISVAMETAKRLSDKMGEPIDWREVYSIMSPATKGKGAGAGGAPFAGMGGGEAVTQSRDGEGVTDDGVDMEEKPKARFRGNGNGHRDRIELHEFAKVTKDGDWIFYRPDQSRDEHGRFEDEGGGAAAAAKEEKPAKEAVTKPASTHHPLKEAGVRAQHPDWSDEEVQKTFNSPEASHVKVPETKTTVAGPTGPEDLDRYLTDIKATPEYKAAKYESEHLAPPGATPEEIENITLKKHSDASGQLSKDREILHEQIVNKYLNPASAVPEGKKPVFFMLLGKPGAGKSTFWENEKGKYGDFTAINPDDIRSHLPEYTGANAPATQQEAKTISDGKLLPRAMKMRANILFDQTGSNGKKMESIVNEMTREGYEVRIAHVYKPLHESVQSAFERFHRQGRFVDADYINGAVDHRPEKTYELLKGNSNVKSWAAIDNTGNKPKGIEEGSR